MRPFIYLLLTVLLGAPAVASAQEPVPPEKAPAAAAEPEKDAAQAWEHSLEANFGTAYVWRGLNLLGQGNQHYSPGVFMPGFSTTKGIWTLGWVGAFQLSGKNLASNVDGAAGLEHDVYVQVEKPLVGDLSWSASLTAYGFPASKEEASGADRSLYVEPSVGVSWGKLINPFFKIHWFHGVQSALADFDYVYLNVGGSRDVELTSKATLKLAGEGGMKVFTGDDTVEDNVWDVQLGAVVEYAATDELTLKGGALFAWSNFAGKKLADEATAWLVAGVCLSW